MFGNQEPFFLKRIKRELCDSLLSKKILTLGAKDEPPPRPKALQLQRMIRYTATLFVQVRRRSRRLANPVRSAP